MSCGVASAVGSYLSAGVAKRIFSDCRLSRLFAAYAASDCHKASHELSIGDFGSKLNLESFEGIGVQFHEMLPVSYTHLTLPTKA